MNVSTITKSMLALALCASAFAGCASPKKQEQPPVAAASVTPADVPADDTYVKQTPKTPVDLGAASSGQGL